MSSTYQVQNLIAATERLTGDLTFAKTAGSVVLTVPDQVNATLSVPAMAGVSQDILLTTQTQNVSNKTITASSIATSTIATDTPFVDTTDSTKQLSVDLSGATASTTTTLEFDQTANRSVAFPDASGTAGVFTDLTGAAVDQLVRMDGTNTIQVSSVTLSDAGALAGVASVTGKAATDLTLSSVAGQKIVLTSDTDVEVTNSASIGGNLLVSGNLDVKGTTTSVNSTVVTIADNNLLLSSNYTTPSAKSGGITVNYLPTATSDTVAAGGFATTTTVATTGAATFTAGDIILVTSANTASNNGVYEVLSHAANVLTIKSSPVFDFLQNVFVVDTTVAGTITQVNVAVLQAGTDGKFEVTKGSSTSGMTFTDLALITDLVGVWTIATVTTTDATPTTAATITPAANRSIVVEVVYTARQQSSDNSNCGKLDREFYNSGTTLNAMGTGTWSYGNFGGNSGSWNIAIVPSGGNALLQVTGEAATSIDWKVEYRYLQSQ
jgi:hypothetical protein